jgi:hypothetical protein
VRSSKMLLRALGVERAVLEDVRWVDAGSRDAALVVRVRALHDERPSLRQVRSTMFPVRPWRWASDMALARLRRPADVHRSRGAAGTLSRARCGRSARTVGPRLERVHASVRGPGGVARGAHGQDDARVALARRVAQRRRHPRARREEYASDVRPVRGGDAHRHRRGVVPQGASLPHGRRGPRFREAALGRARATTRRRCGSSSMRSVPNAPRASSSSAPTPPDGFRTSCESDARTRRSAWTRSTSCSGRHAPSTRSAAPSGTTCDEAERRETPRRSRARDGPCGRTPCCRAHECARRRA